MDIVEQLRNHALPDAHDEREVMHAPLLKKAADEIERLRAAIADAEKQGPVAWIDPAFRNGREDKLIYIPRSDGTSVPLYLHPADSSCDHRYVTTFGGDYCAKCNEPAPSNDRPAAPTVPKIAG